MALRKWRVVSLMLAICAAIPAARAESPRDRLVTYLTDLAHAQTDVRRAAVATIQTRRAARKRQATVRAALVDLIRPEPPAGPVVAQITHREREDGFEMEALWYESLQDYRVTALLYRPDGAGPFPAIIVQPGHGLAGKADDHAFAVNFVRAGFIVLSIDIVGEGERLQHYDPDIGASKVGRPTGEHSMAFAQALPIPGHVSRFFLQDAVRGLDYLVSRADVDRQRIGAFGCSGGGTATAYLAALDRRVAAAAVACYANDMDHLLAAGGPGPQDAEQSIPSFLKRGLDLPDWFELIAPRPLAIVSTTEDMFPIAGARAAYAETARFYGVLGAGRRVSLIEGPGRHGALLPIAPRIVGFFNHWLKGEQSTPPFEAVQSGDPQRLLVFPDAAKGAIHGRSLADVIASEAPKPATRPAETVNARLARLRASIAAVAGLDVAAADQPPPVTLEGDDVQGDHCVSRLHFAAAPNMPVNGVYARNCHAEPRPTILLLTNTPITSATAADPAFTSWMRAGWNVLMLEARGAGGSEELKSPLTGDWTLLSLRALLVGKTPLGMRTDDALAALNWLAARPEVDRRRLAVAGAGPLAPVAVHVGVLDDRVGTVLAADGIVSYRAIAERPISRDAAEVSLPGVLAYYDLPDLMTVLGDRLTLVDPVNVVGEPLRPQAITPLASSPVHIVLDADHDAHLSPELLSRKGDHAD